MGALLLQRGLLPLHANAVEIEGMALAFMGPSGEGKSTLAATFHDMGHRIIADDVVVVRFLPLSRRLGFGILERRIWFFHLAAAMVLLVLLLALPSSKGVDRLALYVMSLQIAVLSRFPLISGLGLGTIIVVLYSLAIEFVWLNFATHARFWIPYQMYPLF